MARLTIHFLSGDEQITDLLYPDTEAGLAEASILVSEMERQWRDFNDARMYVHREPGIYRLTQVYGGDCIRILTLDSTFAWEEPYRDCGRRTGSATIL